MSDFMSRLSQMAAGFFPPQPSATTHASPLTLEATVAQEVKRTAAAIYEMVPAGQEAEYFATLKLVGEAGRAEEYLDQSKASTAQMLARRSAAGEPASNVERLGRQFAALYGHDREALAYVACELPAFKQRFFNGQEPDQESHARACNAARNSWTKAINDARDASKGGRSTLY